MGKLRKLAIGAAAGLGIALGVGWLGLQVTPAPFPAISRPAAPRELITLPADLPAPVGQYLRSALGEQPPLIHRAQIQGRGQLRFAGITFPARMSFTHEAGRRYWHDIEATWFGLPILRVHEEYQNGRARLELPVGIIANEPKVDQGANLALWGEELFWMPTVTVTDPRLRWEGIDPTSARLTVPFGSAEDQFTVRFGEPAGLLRSAEAPRYKDAADPTRTLWRIDVLGEKSFAGMTLPSRVAITWGDEGSPWLTLEVEEVAFD